MDPDGVRLCSIHKLRRRNYISIVAPVSWYIWIVMTISYHMGIPFMVLKVGSPGRCCGSQVVNTKKNPGYVTRLYYNENPKDDERRGRHRKLACEILSIFDKIST